jgi:NAD(P)-dependent dehydrogenase (short-subunit alcohol dehydrogenase family)
MLLANKIAVVSGVGPGMGQQIALGLAREGADVVLAARTESALPDFAAEIESATGRTAVPVPTDFTVAADRERLTATVRERFGHVDILINNAATGGSHKTFMESRLDSWRRNMEFNLFSTLELTQLMVPLMENRDGRIVMINTVSSIFPTARGGPYGASKSALLAMTRVLALELGPVGIRVNSVHPGAIWGPHWIDFAHEEAARRGVSYDEVVAERRARSPLGILPAADEIAGAAVFFATDLARSITGQLLVVDGGSSLLH